MKISSEYWVGYVNSHTKLRRVAANKMADFLYKNKTASVEEIAAFAYALICKYGEASAALACEMYDSVAAAQANAAQYTPAEPAKFASMDEVAKAVQGAAKRSDTLIPSVVGRLVKQAGADTVLQNAARDGAQFAWIPRGDTCAFCITLASRGWQYISKKAMKKGHAEHIHANCDCEYAIRFSEKDNVEGYDPEYYKDLYYNSDVGAKPKDKINFLRRELYKENKDLINAQKRAAYNRTDRQLLRLARDGNTFVVKSEKLYAYSKKIQPINGYTDIVGHGDPLSMVFIDANGNETNVTAAEFGKILEEGGFYTGGNIRLIACQTGKEPAIVAHYLADKFNVNVMAPTEVVNVDFEGNMILADDEEDAKMNIETGKWVVIKPRQKNDLHRTL